MGIGKRLCHREMERIFLIHVRFVHIHRHDISDKHVMASELLDFHNTALNVYRAFFDHRHIDNICLLRRQSVSFHLSVSRPERTPQ